MNIVLFEAAELDLPLRREDRRAEHVLKVLRRSVGEEFDVGQIDGARGKARLVSINADSLSLEFAWLSPPPPLARIQLLIGLPRPQTARKILAEATAMGAQRIDFFPAERGEPQYGQSSLWSSGEWRRHLVDAAAQAFCTRLPNVRLHSSLAVALDLSRQARTRLALDNYEGKTHLHEETSLASPAILAFGAERGWTSPERETLRAHGFAFAHLGPRVLRLETALVAALALTLPRLTEEI